MGYYPQPRPPVYGTRYVEPSPATQTKPVRVGPPSFPPAPPGTDELPEPNGFGREWNSYLSIPCRTYYGERMVLALLYAAASLGTTLSIFLNSPSPLAIIVGCLSAVLSVLVLLSIIWPDGIGYLLCLGLSLLQGAAGLALGQWNSPAVWLALAVAVFMLMPGMRRSYGDKSVRYARHLIRRWQEKHSNRGRVGTPPADHHYRPTPFR